MADTTGRLDATLAALTTALLVLAGGMVVAGVVVPSPSDDEDRRAVPAAEPLRLRVATLDIDADVTPIQLSQDAVLDPPADSDVVGWWDGSAEPGAARGQVVITGHTVHTGGGALDPVARLDQGRVSVVTRAGVQRYRVVDRVVLTREQVAERAQSLFGQHRRSPDGARLVLVTCTDWNGSYYERNVIVLAEPVTA